MLSYGLLPKYFNSYIHKLAECNLLFQLIKLIDILKADPYDQVIKQDAREAMRVVFSVLTKRICMHKTNFLRIYSNIVLKVILICKLQLS